MSKWITAKEGVRYREHPTRKHGVNFDRYYVIRYRDAQGVRHEEHLGWASKGWTAKKAGDELNKLKANHTTGNGAQSLKESREIKQRELAEAEEKRRLEDIRNTTFTEIFEDYIQQSKLEKRNARSWKREEQLARLHLFPVFGDTPLTKIAHVPHLRTVQKNMEAKGLTAATIRYALHVVRIVFNFAIDEKKFFGENPARQKRKRHISGKTAGIEYPQEDNTKKRYLSREEADILLKELLKRSQDVHDIAMLSLYTGMRFGEIANLKWGEVNIFRGDILLKNTKSKKDRIAYIRPEVQKMFARKGQGLPNQLVFPARGTDKPRYMISSVYYDTVKKLFNEGIADKKEWVNFHTLRHTFASWLVEKGTDIYFVKDLLGHHDLKMTERYAHIGENQLKQAVLNL